MTISANFVGDSNDENNILHKLSLTNTQISRFRKAFANGSSINMKLSKTQLHKIGESGGFSGRLLRSLVKTGLPLIGNSLKPLTKSILIPPGLTSTASATDSAIHEKKFGSGTTALVFSNEGLNYIIKIVNSYEEFGLLI